MDSTENPHRVTIISTPTSTIITSTYPKNQNPIKNLNVTDSIVAPCQMHYYRSKPRAAPEKIKPYLTSFTLFLKLPIEIQDMIWRLTLQPRTVELEYSTVHGFYTRASAPVALKACANSRKAVINSYPLCFGSRLHSPHIVFNFSLDTLYFDNTIQARVTQFLVAMSKTEIENVQFIAVDVLIDHLEGRAHIDELRDRVYISEDDAVDTFALASHAMPALKEFLIVHKLECRHSLGNVGGSLPSGNGPMVLLEEVPYKLQMYMWSKGFYLRETGDFSDCLRVPVTAPSIQGSFAPKVRDIFGWRPTALPEPPEVPLWAKRTRTITWRYEPGQNGS